MEKGMSCKVGDFTDFGTSCNLDDSGTVTVIKSRMKTTTTTCNILPSKRCVSKGTSTASDPLKAMTVVVTDASKEDSESDVEEEIATDNLLGRLRNGIRLIQVHARETMAQCDTEECRADMAKRLESAAIGMLRAEKSFLNTASIIADVVDQYASDFEERDNDVDDEEEDNLFGITSNPSTDESASALRQNETANRDKSEPDEVETVESSDDKNREKETVIPIFRPTAANGASIRNYGRKLSKIMLQRFSNYEKSLTDEILKGENKILTLKEQIRFGSMDSENKIKRRQSCLETGGGDTETSEYTLTLSRSSAIEFDDEEYDESILPSIDPITKQSIFNAVRNKYCNHVFDEQSILCFMLENPGIRCPIHGCLNERPLDPEHFVEEIKLSERIRRKNDKYTAFS